MSIIRPTGDRRVLNDYLNDDWVARALHDESQLELAAAHHVLPPALWDALVTSTNTIIAWSAAINTAAPAGLLARLHTHPEADIAEAARANPNIDYALIADSPALAAVHPAAPHDVVWAGLGRYDEDPDSVQRLVATAQLTEAMRTKLTAVHNPDLDYALLKCPTTTHGEALALLAGPDFYHHTHAAGVGTWLLHPNSDPDWVQALLHSSYRTELGFRLLGSPHLTADNVTGLLNDYPQVTYQALRHPNLSTAALNYIVSSDKLAGWTTDRGRLLAATHPKADATTLSLLSSYDFDDNRDYLEFIRTWAVDVTDARILATLLSTWSGTLAELLETTAGISTTSTPTVLPAH